MNHLCSEFSHSPCPPFPLNYPGSKSKFGLQKSTGIRCYLNTDLNKSSYSAFYRNIYSTDTIFFFILTQTAFTVGRVFDESNLKI